MRSCLVAITHVTLFFPFRHQKPKNAPFESIYNSIEEKEKSSLKYDIVRNMGNVHYTPILGVSKYSVVRFLDIS